jgi:hypothetical protein
MRTSRFPPIPVVPGRRGISQKRNGSYHGDGPESGRAENAQLRTFGARVMIRSMSSDDELSYFQNGYWRVQPIWVKVLTISVAVPAFLVLVTGAEGRIETVALIAFAAIAILQLATVVGAYWRMDL